MVFKRELEKQIAELEKDKAYTENQLDEQIQATLKLQKENAELKEQLDAIDKAGEHARQQINDAFRNKKPYWELEKENAELKEELKNWKEVIYKAEQFLKEIEK